MSSAEIGKKSVPNYFSGCLVDDAGGDEDVPQVAKESIARAKTRVLEKLMARLGALLANQLSAPEKRKSKPKLTKLDKAVYMSKTGPLTAHITILFVDHEQKIVSDDTLAIDSVLKADVSRDHLLKEEAALNSKLAELEAEGDDKRCEDAPEEAQEHLVEVHVRIVETQAENGPARLLCLQDWTSAK